MSTSSSYAKLSQSIQRHPLPWAVLTVVLFVAVAVVLALALRPPSSSDEEAGYANAKAFALEWLQKVSEDKGIEIMPDANIKLVRLQEMVQEAKQGDKWAKYSRHKLAPLFDAWDGKGEVWKANGSARSEKHGWVYHFDLFMRRTRLGNGRGEHWEVLRFKVGGETGDRPSFTQAYQINR